MHRDISEGNILFTPFTAEAASSTDHWSDSESTLVDSDEEEDTTVVDYDFDTMFSGWSLLSGGKLSG